MTLPLVYRPEARDDIDEAFAWYERKQAGLGDQFLAALQTTLQTVQANPTLYAVLRRGVRAAPLQTFPYVAYYRVEIDRIVVIAVLHGGRSARAWQSRA